MGAAWAACCALAGAPQAELEAHDVQQMTDSTNDELADKWSRPTTWPPRKRLPERGPDAPHVVLSTKFQEPWFTISIGIKEVLEELGCTVYNPNTDNKARSRPPPEGLIECQDSLAARSSTRTKPTTAGCAPSARTWTRSRRSAWANNGPSPAWVSTPLRSPTFEEVAAWRSSSDGLGVVRAHRERGAARQRRRHGPRHGWGTSWYASGEIYEGEFQNGNRHGKGTYMYKSGNVKVCVYEQGEDKGWGVQITADGQRACLMLDGEIAREVTVAEARGVARELGLPDLPYTNVSAKDALEEC
eukprot:s3084_g2.t2